MSSLGSADEQSTSTDRPIDDVPSETYQMNISPNNEKFYLNEMGADVDFTFKLSDERIRAHKRIWQQ